MKHMSQKDVFFPALMVNVFTGLITQLQKPTSDCQNILFKAPKKSLNM